MKFQFKSKRLFFLAIPAIFFVGSIFLFPSEGSAHFKRSYPVLKAGQNYKFAEVRKGRSQQAFNDMTTVLHSPGPVSKGQFWQGVEGERICARATNNQESNLKSQPIFCASGWDGISEGRAEESTF